jgi:hypothetical protein
MIIAKKRIKSDASYRGNMWRIMLTRHPDQLLDHRSGCLSCC